MPSAEVPARPPVVTARQGQLQGRWMTTPGGAVALFRGVPYAAAPVGELRWRPALPPARWDSVRPATQPGPAPVQTQPPRDSLLFQANYADRRPLVMSEDCLHLDVWTPDPGAVGLPVLVWIPGGGYRFGSGSLDLFDGRALARHGCVVVSVTHRLGALGFLAHGGLGAESADGASGNYGLTDVLAALTWVQDNIAAFGGSPDRVTAFGSSAGAATLCHLMASPRAHGLFQQVIGQSMSGFEKPGERMASLAEAEAVGERFTATVGARDVAGLRRLSATQLVGGAGWGPIVEPRVLPLRTADVFEAGGQHPLPLLAGHNADEGSPYVRADTALPTTSGLREHYRVDDPTARRRYLGDSQFDYRVWRWADTHARTAGAGVWCYRFDRNPPVPTDARLAPPGDGLATYGAFHTAELPYVWSSLQARDWAWTPGDHELAAEMTRVWATFAATGDPGSVAGIAWPRFTDAERGPVLVLDRSCRLDRVRRADALAALHAGDPGL